MWVLIVHCPWKAISMQGSPRADQDGTPTTYKPRWEGFSKNGLSYFNRQPPQHLPIFLMYQFFPPWDPFQYRAPAELTKAMTKRMPNKTRICTLVTFSTFDLLRGALVEFCTTTFKINKGHRTGLGARSREEMRQVTQIQQIKNKRL